MPALAGRTPPQKLNTTCFPPKISTDVVFGAAPLGTRDRHVRVGSAGHRFHHPDFHRRQRVGTSNSRSPGVRFPYTARLQPTFLLHSFDPDPLNTEATRNAVRAVDTSNGQFEIRGVRPGPYELVISVPGGGSAYIGRKRINAGYQDVKDVTIVVRPGADVPVHVVATTGSNITAVRNVELRIKDSPRPIGIAGATGGKESFSIQHVPAGEYEVSVTIAPDTSVADIQQAGRSVLKEGIIVGDEPSEPLRLILERTRP